MTAEKLVAVQPMSGPMSTAATSSDGVTLTSSTWYRESSATSGRATNVAIALIDRATTAAPTLNCASRISIANSAPASGTL